MMKKLRTSARIALRALRVNRARSALTMLGIIIGVAAVIAMVGVGSGATERNVGRPPAAGRHCALAGQCAQFDPG